MKARIIAGALISAFLIASISFGALFTQHEVITSPLFSNAAAQLDTPVSPELADNDAGLSPYPVGDFTMDSATFESARDTMTDVAASPRQMNMVKLQLMSKVDAAGFSNLADWISVINPYGGSFQSCQYDSMVGTLNSAPTITCGETLGIAMMLAATIATILANLGSGLIDLTIPEWAFLLGAMILIISIINDINPDLIPALLEALAGLGILVLDWLIDFLQDLPTFVAFQQSSTINTTIESNAVVIAQTVQTVLPAPQNT